MKLVGAGFRNCIDNGIRMQAIARGNAAGLDTEFLKCVRERKWQIHIRVRIVVVAAIQQIVIAFSCPPEIDTPTELA